MTGRTDRQTDRQTDGLQRLMRFLRDGRTIGGFESFQTMTDTVPIILTTVVIILVITFYFDFLIINFKSLFLSAMRSLSWRERNVAGLTQASCVLN